MEYKSLFFALVPRSPDGTCLLTCSDDDVMRLYNLPTELYQSGATEKLPEIVSII